MLRFEEELLFEFSGGRLLGFLYGLETVSRFAMFFTLSLNTRAATKSLELMWPTNLSMLWQTLDQRWPSIEWDMSMLNMTANFFTYTCRTGFTCCLTSTAWVSRVLMPVMLTLLWSPRLS